MSESLRRLVRASRDFARKRPREIVVLAMLFMGSGAAFTTRGTAPAAAANIDAAMIPDPESLLAQRSPGERPDGALYSTKPPRFADVANTVRSRPGAGAPSERVLSNERTRPPAAGAAPPPEATPFVPALPVVAFDEPGFGGAGIPGGPGFGGIPGGIGAPGGGGGGGGGIVPTPPQEPPSAIPEPATWAMMILGFLSVGAMMRRARPRALRISDAV